MQLLEASRRDAGSGTGDRQGELTFHSARLEGRAGGRVGEVLGTGDLVQRLREMGLYDGASVQMIRPGSPCIIRLQGQRLGFRTDDLARVMVRVSTAAS